MTINFFLSPFLLVLLLLLLVRWALGLRQTVIIENQKERKRQPICINYRYTDNWLHLIGTCITHMCCVYCDSMPLSNIDNFNLSIFDEWFSFDGFVMFPITITITSIKIMWKRMTYVVHTHIDCIHTMAGANGRSFRKPKNSRRKKHQETD